MKERLENLIREAQKHSATDIHFTIRDQQVKIAMRSIRGFIDIEGDGYDLALFNFINIRQILIWGISVYRSPVILK